MPNLGQFRDPNRDFDRATCQRGHVSVFEGKTWPHRRSRARRAAVTCLPETQDKIPRPVPRPRTALAPTVDGTLQSLPTGAEMVGTSVVLLACLGNMVEATPVVSVRRASGEFPVAFKEALAVELQPLDATGSEGPWDDAPDRDPFVESAEELLGRDIAFTVHLKWLASPVCQNYSQLWVRYQYDPGEEGGGKWHGGGVHPGHAARRRVPLAYSKTHRLHVDRRVLSVVGSGEMRLEVYGLPRRSPYSPH